MTLHDQILAEPRDLSHREAHRRLTARGVEVSLALVARVRAAKYGPRKLGRTPTNADTVLLATLRDHAKALGHTPIEVVEAGVASIKRRQARR